jgi:hypothetical protein
MSSDDITYLDMLVTEIEKNIPIQQMYIDKSNEAVSVEESDSRFDDVYQMAVAMLNTLKAVRGDSTKVIIDDLMKSEPFCHYPKLKDLLTDNIQD